MFRFDKDKIDRKTAEDLERAELADLIAGHLREMSEMAFRARLAHSCSLIEIAAQVIEFEGRRVPLER